MAILVTGCSGFAGSHISTALASAGKQVFGLYRSQGGEFLEAIPRLDNLKLVQGDIASIQDLANLSEAPIDMVVHVASTSPGPNITVGQLMADNVSSMANLIDWCLAKRIKKFVYFSSMSAFGQIKEKIVNEDHPVIDPDPYGLSKRAAEQLLEDISHVMPSVSIRLPGILGKGAHRNWISGAKAKLLANAPVSVFHPEAPFNNAVHVDDLARLILDLEKQDFKGSDYFITGAAGEITVMEAVETMKNAIGSTSEITPVAEASSPSFALDSSKAMRIYNYRPMQIDQLLRQYASE